MMRAAARLGLDLGAAKRVWKKSSNVFVSSLAAVAEEADVGKETGMISGSEKSLYLCFSEESRRGNKYFFNQVVRPIRLNSDDDGGKEEYMHLRDAAYRRCHHIKMELTSCSHLGSQILFPFGCGSRYTRFGRVDTSTRPLKFQKFKPSFSCPKYEPVLLEANGKIYCIDRLSDRIFEVLDPEDDFKWRRLDDTPFWGFEQNIVVSSNKNKIFGWNDKQEGVYCFDVTKPENGWTEPCSHLSYYLPFLGYRRLRPPVFIHNHHPLLGDFYLIFSYHPYKEPYLVHRFFLSNTCDSFYSMEPIHLPQQLCSHYIPVYGQGCESESDTPFPSDYDSDIEGCEFPSSTICTDFDIVHLGGQKFCLVFHKFFSDDPVQGRNKSTVLLVTFEYDVIPIVKSSSSIVDVDIQTRFLGSRRFRYRPMHPVSTETTCQHLIGAFVI